MDGSGFSRDMAEKRIGRKIVAGSTEVPPSASPERKPRHSGHVRDFESDRDHELAAERAAYKPPSAEQPEINQRGRALVDAALDEQFGKDRHVARIINEVHEQIPLDPNNTEASESARSRMISARLRTYFDSKK